MASSFVSDIAKGLFGTGDNWSTVSTGVYYVTLLSNNYVPNQAHSYASNFSGAELSSTSFTAGFNGTVRLSLVGRTVFSNTTSHQAEFRATAAVWSAISAGVAHAFCVVKQAGSDGLSPIIAYVSTGGFPITTNGGDLTVSFANSWVFLMADGA